MERKFTEFEYEAKACDHLIRYCTNCKQCWEIIRKETNNGLKKIGLKNIYYYKDFPSYGKEKKTCLHCSKLEHDAFIDKFYMNKRDIYKKLKQKKEI